MSKDPNSKNKLQEQLDTLNEIEVNAKNESIRNIAKLMRKITLIQKNKNDISDEAFSLINEIQEAYKLGDKQRAEDLLVLLENLPYKESYMANFGAIVHIYSLLLLRNATTQNNKISLIHKAYYTLVKNPSIVNEKGVDSILSYLLKCCLDKTLPFTCKRIKELCAEKAFVNSYYEHNVVGNIIDFDRLCLYWKYCDESNDLNDIKAILYYYLGSPVDAFIIFDEVLDNGEVELTAQQLFYYVLTSKEIDVEFEAISHDAINILDNKTSKSPIDFYYLGLIQIICNDLSNGLNNLEQANSNYAKAIIHYYNSGQLSIKDNFVNRTIDINNVGLSQFEEYLYISECNIVCYGATKRKLWSTFFLSDEDKKNNGTIERFLISKQAPLIESALVEKCKSSLVKNLSDDQILEQKKARLEHLLYEINPKIRRIYQETKAGFDAGYDIENQIGLTIEDYTLESPDAYILIIYYFYLQRSIDDDCVIRLCLYLYNTSINHYKSQIKGAGTNLSLSIANPILILLCPYIDIRQLSTVTKEIFDMVRKKQEDLKNPIHIQLKSEYLKFKDGYQRHLIMKKKELGEIEFIEHFKLCEFQHKLVQLDQYLVSITRSI